VQHTCPGCKKTRFKTVCKRMQGLNSNKPYKMMLKVQCRNPRCGATYDLLKMQTQTVGH